MTLSSSLKIGFIGAGKMGGAIIKGLVSFGHPGHNIFVNEHSEEKLNNLVKQCKIQPLNDPTSVARKSDAVVVAVHPGEFGPVLNEIKSTVGESKPVISVAAGLTCETLQQMLGSNGHVVRAMPNICAEVCESISGITPGKFATPKDIEITEKIFNAVGKTLKVKEDLYDAFAAVTGCGLAFVFPIIEAMADGGVFEGIDRQTAITLAAQTLVGAGKLVALTGSHPEKLKDDTCSPGGSTIVGVRTLEEGKVRAAYMNAVISATEKMKEMRKIK